ncbi:M10L1 helicase, partial [Corythaeola cristata]|nr:M10L1 helicase [Corythaeola cristata]
MLGLFSKALSYFWRRADDEEGEDRGAASGDKELKTVQGVVTRFYHDYGMIDDIIIFTKDAVTKNTLLTVGQEVTATVEEDKTSGGLKAIRVHAIQNTWRDSNPTWDASEPNTKILIGSITSLSKDGGYINQNTFFAMEEVCEGFKPCEGDWVHARYFINPTTWNSEAVGVKPLRYKQVDKVRISSICGRSGTVDDSIFFTLDSLRLPDGYSPCRDDLVNTVVVESNQSCYIWRALCLVPVSQDRQSHSNGVNLDEPYEDLMEDKGGLEVSRMTNFGTLKQGESKRMTIWIENKGSIPQSLISCRFAGWVKDKQFSFQIPQKCENSPEGYLSSFPINQENLSKAAINSYNDSGGITYESLNTTSIMKNGVIPGTVKYENLHNGENEQREDVKQLIKHVNITGEIVIPPDAKTFIVIICTAMISPTFSTSCVYHQSSVLSSLKRGGAKLLLRTVKRYASGSSGGNVWLIFFSNNNSRMSFYNNNVYCFIFQHLNLDNYKANFSTLLWLEEIHAETEIKDFNMSGVTLKRNGNLLVLEVPGVEEGRPHLTAGSDKVILKSQVYSEHIIEYVAYITEICNEDVTLKCNADFEQSYNLEPMDVEFVHCRYFYKFPTSCFLCGFQISLLSFSSKFEVLFPEKLVLQSPQATKTQSTTEYCGVDDDLEQCSQQESKVSILQCVLGLSWFTQLFSPRCGAFHFSLLNFMSFLLALWVIGETVTLKQRAGEFFNPMLNEQQKLAVKRILSGECRPTPYVLFGPPGTGKTLTVIEAILQIHYTLPHSRILVCAPSNAATDLICLRLHQSNLLKPGAMVRVNASFRSAEQIDDMVKPYCEDGDDIRKASWFRIVISTCSSAGMFYQTEIRLGHFTHVIVDEAGQATEPESLIPLGLISEANGQVVLLASFTERKEVLVYFVDFWFSSLQITKLVKNYRSHSALLTLPSKLFYHKELEVCADASVVNSLLHWGFFFRKGFPLIFHGIRGSETREGHSPSWFNPTEAVQVMQYCCHLAKSENTAVSVTDIGVITPYRKQVFFLSRNSKVAVFHLLVLHCGFFFLKHGGISQIFTVVRSHEGFFGEDKHSLGFLCDPRRFNVAVTRAKALQIVVGNPHVLVKDPCFCALLEYSLMNRVYVGCDLPPELECLQK